MRPAFAASLLIATVLYWASTSHAQPSPFPKPGPEHAALKKMEGTWDVTMTLLGSIKAKGEAVAKMECGGLWLERNLKCDLGGVELHAKGLDTYDPIKKKYVSIQIDSMSTAPLSLEGNYDESSTTLTQVGEGRDFKGAVEQIKTITKRIDDDHTKVEVYRIFPDGKEKKMVVIEYARRKAK
jgi:hypothetical protein